MFAAIAAAASFEGLLITDTITGRIKFCMRSGMGRYTDLWAERPAASYQYP